VAVELSRAVGARRSRRWLEAIVRQAEPQIRAAIEQRAGEWQRAAEAVIGPFTSARMTRDKAIADCAASGAADAFQPGLFDRRAERQREQLAEAAASADAAIAERLAASARAAAIVRRAPQLLMVLAP
jgi:hypothetical protein